MPIRSLSKELHDFILLSVPGHPAALTMLAQQGRIVTRNHKRDLLAEIDRFKRASPVAARSPFIELWNWVNSIQFPPLGVRMSKGRYIVSTFFSRKNNWHVALFLQAHDSEHTRGYGGSPELAVADLAKTYQLGPEDVVTE